MRDVFKKDFSRTAASFFCCVLGLVLSFFYYISRIGFSSNPILPVLNCAGVCLFLVAGPTVLSFWKPGKDGWPEKLFIAWGPLVLFLMVLLSSYSNSSVVLPLIVLTGFAAFGVVSYRFFMEGFLRKSLLFLFFSIWFSIWVACIVWGSGYLSPIFDVFLATGKAHADVLYQASISSMIKTYGFPSSGLDGIPYLPYHYGSNWIFVRFSTFLSLPIITFFQMGYPIIFVTAFFSSFLSFVLFLSEARPVRTLLKSHFSRFFWIVWTLFFVGFLPIPFLHNMAMGFSTYLLGESYCVGLMAFFWFLTVVLSHFSEERISSSARAFKLADFAFIVFFIPLFVGVLGFLKISFMYLSTGMFFYLFIRLALFKRVCFLFSAFVVSVVFLWVKGMCISAETSQATVAFFHYLSRYIKPAWIPAYFIFYFIWPLAYGVIVLRANNVTSFASLRQSFAKGKLIDAELIAVVAVLGMLPGAVLAIPGSGAVSFQEFQSFLGVACVLAGLRRAGEGVDV